MKRPGIERVSPLATRSCHARIAAIDLQLIRDKTADARASKRGREIHIFHTGDEDTLQRMLNAIQPGSYVAPHRHVATPKAESILLVQGSLGFVPFDDGGTPDTDGFVHIAKEAGTLGVDYRAGLWHTFLALKPDTVVFEVKPGPYDPATDKEFAPWAPREDAAGAVAYLASLEDRFRSQLGLPGRRWQPER